MNTEVDRFAGEAAAAADFAPPPFAMQAYVALLESQVQWIRGAISILVVWPFWRAAREGASDGACGGNAAGADTGMHCLTWGGAGSAGESGGFR